MMQYPEVKMDVDLGTSLLTGPLFNNSHFVNYVAIWATISEFESGVLPKFIRESSPDLTHTTG